MIVKKDQNRRHEHDLAVQRDNLYQYEYYTNIIVVDLIRSKF